MCEWRAIMLTWWDSNFCNLVARAHTQTNQVQLDAPLRLRCRAARQFNAKADTRREVICTRRGGGVMLVVGRWTEWQPGSDVVRRQRMRRAKRGKTKKLELFVALPRRKRNAATSLCGKYHSGELLPMWQHNLKRKISRAKTRSLLRAETATHSS